MNRARRFQGVDAERRLIFERLVDRDVPFRLPGRERQIRHPGGEAFVQPEIVPPPHRDEIAEPLVRHLVREHGRDVLARGDRRVSRVGQQIGLPIEDRGGVLHGARGEIGYTEHVELLVRVFDIEVAVVELHDPLGGLERDPSEILLVRRRANPDRHAVLLSLQALEIANGHRNQIGRHLGRRVEFQCVSSWGWPGRIR